MTKESSTVALNLRCEQLNILHVNCTWKIIDMLTHTPYYCYYLIQYNNNNNNNFRAKKQNCQGADMDAVYQHPINRI